MKAYQDLKCVVVCDIETAKITETYSQLSPEMQYCWNKIADKIIKEENLVGFDYQDLYVKKAALYAEFAKIISFGYSTFEEGPEGQLQLKVNDFSGHDEAEILTKIGELATKVGFNLTLVGHNIKNFDLPFICKRFIINGMVIPASFDIRGKKPWEIKHQDTSEIWGFGSYKGYQSLNTLTTVLGVASSKDDIDGSQVDHVYYKEKNLPRIVKYCIKDVIATAQVYLKLNYTPVVESVNIITDIKEELVM